MQLKEYLKLMFRAWKYRLRSDKNEIRFLLDTIKKGSVALDVGAHKGGYTYWMVKAVGKDGRVIAFEPQQKGAALLRRLFTGNNTVVENLAVSDHDGLTRLYIQPQSYDVSFEASLHNKYETSIVQEIQTTTIDNYCALHQLSPSFIKIDVEGAEQNVINGAKNILLKCRPFLMLEIEARHIGTTALLQLCRQVEAAGYRGYFFYQDNKLLFDSFDAGLHQNTAHLNTARYANNFLFEPL